MPSTAQLEALEKARTAKANKAAETDVNDVHIYDAADVERLMIELAEEKRKRAEAEHGKAIAEAKAHTNVPRGLPSAEIADPFVPDEDRNIPGLNDTTDSQTIHEATLAGKRGYSRVTHRLNNDKVAGSAHTYWMYDVGGYARKVQRQSLSSAIASGLSPVCPLCKGYHKLSETNPNACPSRPTVKRTLCSICRANGSVRYIYDTQIAAPLNDDGISMDEALDDDDTLTVLAVPSSSEDRLRIRLEEHIRAYHVATAASMKLG